MAELASYEVVRSRYPLTPVEDETDLQAYAELLDQLRDRMRADNFEGIEIAVTFDPRRDGSDE